MGKVGTYGPPRGRSAQHRDNPDLAAMTMGVIKAWSSFSGVWFKRIGAHKMCAHVVARKGRTPKMAEPPTTRALQVATNPYAVSNSR